MRSHSDFSSVLQRGSLLRVESVRLQEVSRGLRQRARFVGRRTAHLYHRSSDLLTISRFQLRIFGASGLRLSALPTASAGPR